MTLPSENLTYTRVDDGQFYISRTINEMHDVGSIAGQFLASCEMALHHARLLRAAGDAGVARAAALATVAEGVSAFADEEAAAAFLAAFRAARDAP